MFQIFAHPHLTHELQGGSESLKNSKDVTNLILVSVHSGQRADMSEDVLKGIGKLERIDVSEAKLNVRVHDQFGKTQNFTTKMECVSESRFLSLLRGQCPSFYRLEYAAPI